MKTNLFLLVASATLLAATTPAAEPDINTPRHSCCANLQSAAASVSDRSLYQLAETWTSDRGNQIALSSLKGRPQIVTMFFAHCQYACPLLVYKMEQIEAALPENLRTNIGFTLVSFDAERDTPDVLHAYRTRHRMGNHWTLLHGNADQVLELAALLGVKFKQDAQGQFAHSNIITLLNGEGEIVYQEVGLNLQTEELVRQIRTVAGTLKPNCPAHNCEN